MKDRRVSAVDERSRWWWMPLALIAVALVLIVSLPLITGRKLERLRQHERSVNAPALVWVNDLEAAIGAEAAARSEIAERSSDAIDARAAAEAARRTQLKDLRTLDSLATPVGPVAATLLADARAAVEAWQRQEDALTAAESAGVVDGPSLTAIRGQRWRAAEDAFAKVQQLDDEIAQEGAREVTEIVRIEELDARIPLFLVPLALLGLAAVGFTARRTRKLSQAATEGRLAAEAALAARSALMRGVTHDLKNPLGAARGYIDLLSEGAMGPVPERQVPTVARLRGLINVTLATVGDLLELSRADSGSLRIEARETNIADTVRELASDFNASAASAGIRIELDAAAPGDVAITTDPKRVRQVVDNLLSNAVKYTRRGSTVRLRVARLTDPVLSQVVAIDVADDGDGIPADLHERVFDEFFRAPHSTGIAQGTGVGLSIARRVARLLGGDLRLRDTPGGGATFTLLLPDGDLRRIVAEREQRARKDGLPLAHEQRSGEYLRR